LSEFQVTFDPTTALIVVDMQNDFADPSGGLYVQGGERVVTEVNDLIAAAVQAGSFVVFTQDWHPPTTEHFKQWPVHCVQRTWGAELHPRLIARSPVVQTGANGEDGYSGFTAHDLERDEEVPTELEGLLHSHDVSTVVVCGLAEDYCVKETVLDACRLGFNAVVPLRATAAVAGDAASARKEMEAAGAVLT
jgi:nicotinamidase/pyrazinamidase